MLPRNLQIDSVFQVYQIIELNYSFNITYYFSKCVKMVSCTSKDYIIAGILSLKSKTVIIIYEKTDFDDKISIFCAAHCLKKEPGSYAWKSHGNSIANCT